MIVMNKTTCITVSEPVALEEVRPRTQENCIEVQWTRFTNWSFGSPRYRYFIPIIMIDGV